MTVFRSSLPIFFHSSVKWRSSGCPKALGFRFSLDGVLCRRGALSAFRWIKTGNQVEMNRLNINSHKYIDRPLYFPHLTIVEPNSIHGFTSGSVSDSVFRNVRGIDLPGSNPCRTSLFLCPRRTVCCVPGQLRENPSAWSGGNFENLLNSIHIRATPNGSHRKWKDFMAAFFNWICPVNIAEILAVLPDASTASASYYPT
jgi:hypothetical protein